MAATRVTLLRTAVVAAIAIGALVIAGPLVSAWRPAQPVAAADGPTPGITVSGIGRVTLKPDLATLSVGVQVQAASASKAQSQASSAMNAVIDAVKALGIAGDDLTTQWVSLDPVYDYNVNGTQPKVIGYRASQNLSVKVRDIAKTGDVIDAAVGAGANQVSGITFSVADPAAATAQARTAAVADAKARAQALASAAGVSLGAPTTITETSSPAPVPYLYAPATPERRSSSGRPTSRSASRSSSRSADATCTKKPVAPRRDRRTRAQGTPRYLPYLYG